MRSRDSVYGPRLEEQVFKSSETWICNVRFFGILIGVGSSFTKICNNCALPTAAALAICRSARGSGTETLGFVSLSFLFRLSDCIPQETTSAGYYRMYQIVIINLFWSNEFRLGRLSLHLNL